eukprot:119613-Prorocentrum_minimum.AAC.1
MSYCQPSTQPRWPALPSTIYANGCPCRPGTHESGQLVWDKQRHWRPLQLCLYFNLKGKFFYPLLTDYLGQ